MATAQQPVVGQFERSAMVQNAQDNVEPWQELVGREVAMRNWIRAAASIVLAFPSSTSAQSKDALVVTWKLVSATNTTEKYGVRLPIKNSFGSG